MAIHKSLQPSLEDYSPISDRILSATFNLPEGKIHIFQVYAPTEQASEYAVSKFYDQLHEELQKAQSNGKEMLVVMGDFNAQVGHDLHKTLYPDVLGKHGTSTHISKNGEQLLHLCSVHRLRVTNTMFQHKRIHKVTWYSPDNRTQNLIDYILVNTDSCHKVLNTRVFRGAMIDSDHKLLCSVLALNTTKQHHNQGSTCQRPLYDMGKLASSEHRGQFQLLLQNRFSALSPDVDDPEVEWKMPRRASLTQLPTLSAETSQKETSKMVVGRNDSVE